MRLLNRYVVVIVIIASYNHAMWAASSLPRPVYVVPTESIDRIGIAHSAYAHPVDNPTPPGDIFTPPFTGTVSASCPQVADFTRQCGSEELFILQGANFGTSPTVWCYTQTTTNDGVLYAATVDQALAQTLTVATAPSANYGMTLVWVENEGQVGLPVRLNAAELWWVNHPVSLRGADVTLFGRNLTFGNGTTTSSVYVRKWGAPVSTPSLPCTVTNQNPYRVDIKLPTSLSVNTDYELWLHNGHGGIFGWTGPLRISVVASLPYWGWPGSTITVTAGGNIQSALSSAVAGQTVKLEAGVYTISSPLSVPRGIQVSGAGSNSTVITASSTFAGSYMINAIPGNTRLNDLAVDTNGSRELPLGVVLYSGYGIDPIPEGAYANRLRIVYPGGWQYPCIQMSWCRLGEVTFCDLTGGRGIMMITVENSCVWCNYFYGNQTGLVEEGALFCGWSLKNLDCNGNRFSSLNRAGGQVARRAVAIQNHYGPSYHCYFGKNWADGVGPLYGATGQNIGETFMIESRPTSSFYTPGTVTTNSVTFAGQNWTVNALVTDDLPGWSQQSDASILYVNTGAGAGQWRKIVANTADTVTIEKPWDVVPSTNDKFCIMESQTRTVFYQNNISFSPDENGNGINDNLEIERGSAGIMFYGSVLDSDIFKNSVLGNRYGIYCSGRYYSGTNSSELQPQNGIIISNNDSSYGLKNNWVGIYIGPWITANGSGAFAGGPVQRNIVVRKNKIDHASGGTGTAGIKIQRGNPYYTWVWGWTENTVLDGNSILNTAVPILIPDSYSADTVIW